MRSLKNRHPPKTYFSSLYTPVAAATADEGRQSVAAECAAV
jgi:hypothetical protein